MTAFNRIQVIARHILPPPEGNHGRFLNINPTAGTGDRSIERITKIVHHLADSASISPPKLIERVANRPLPLTPSTTIFSLFQRALHSLLAFFKII